MGYPERRVPLVLWFLSTQDTAAGGVDAFDSPRGNALRIVDHRVILDFVSPLSTAVRLQLLASPGAVALVSVQCDVM